MVSVTTDKNAPMHHMSSGTYNKFSTRRPSNSPAGRAVRPFEPRRLKISTGAGQMCSKNYHQPSIHMVRLQRLPRALLFTSYHNRSSRTSQGGDVCSSVKRCKEPPANAHIHIFHKCRMRFLWRAFCCDQVLMSPGDTHSPTHISRRRLQLDFIA